MAAGPLRHGRRGLPTRRLDPTAAWLLAAVVAAHALAHLGAGVNALSALTAEATLSPIGAPWETTNPVVLGALGAAWTAVGMTLLLVSVAVARRARAWPRLLMAASLLSLVLVPAGLWWSLAIAVVDLVLLATAVAAGRATASVGSAGRPHRHARRHRAAPDVAGRHADGGRRHHSRIRSRRV